MGLDRRHVKTNFCWNLTKACPNGDRTVTPTSGTLRGVYFELESIDAENQFMSDCP